MTLTTTNHSMCPVCGRAIHAQRFAELHRRTFHPTPDEQAVDRTVAAFDHAVWALWDDERKAKVVRP